MIAPSGEQIEIALGDQRAVVVEVGGGLRAYSAGGRELIDGYGADAMSASGRGQVLIPWPNRLEDGCYEFDGRRIQFCRRIPEVAHQLHLAGVIPDVSRRRTAWPHGSCHFSNREQRLRHEVQDQARDS